MRLMINAGLIDVQRYEQIKKFVTKYDISQTNDVICHFVGDGGVRDRITFSALLVLGEDPEGFAALKFAAFVDVL
jgi:hypothetical protein